MQLVFLAGGFGTRIGGGSPRQTSMSRTCDIFQREAGFEARPFTRLKQRKYLITTGQLDEQLFRVG